jgi:hypothetical protein
MVQTRFGQYANRTGSPVLYPERGNDYLFRWCAPDSGGCFGVISPGRPEHMGVSGTFDTILLAGIDHMGEQIFKRALYDLNPRYQVFVPGVQ